MPFYFTHAIIPGIWGLLGAAIVVLILTQYA
jgi:hypothetical protein